MNEKKNVFRKIDAFLKRHPWGCVGWSFFVLLISSLVFLFAFNGCESAVGTDRGIWTNDVGYIITTLFGLSIIFVSLDDIDVDESLFFCICWLALALAETWCWFFGLTFLLPVNILLIVCLYYLFWRKSIPKVFIWKKILWLFIGTGIAFGVSYRQYFVYQETQRGIQKALQTPVIELIDVKDSYIFTKEFGLERVSDKTPLDSIKKGDKVHRLKTDNCVLIVKQH